MIKTKIELKEWLEMDRKANNLPDSNFKHWFKRFIYPNYIWSFIVTLRKCEYYETKTGGGGKIIFAYYKWKKKRLAVKLGFCIPNNVFGPGLSIPHYGMIVVHHNARVGKNCRLMHGVTIGATSGKNFAATIGDNVFLGTNCVLLGGIKIANNVSVAANATVVKDCLIEKAMLAGTPAQIKKYNCPLWWEYNGLRLEM